MNKFLSTRAKDLTPYVPGEQPKANNLIKLNTNENPYPPSDKALKAIISAADRRLTKYPKPECEDIRSAIAKVENLPNIDYVYVGNGSDEVLAFCFQAFFDNDKDVLFPDVTYSFYPVYCNLYDLKYKLIPLKDDLTIDVDDYNEPNTGIIFPNPNAPTGEYLELEKIERLLKTHKDRVVIIDEAYIEFGGQSCVSLIKDYENLVIVRTLSKSHGLAGLRCGYVMGQAHLIDGIIRVKNSFNSYTCDALAQVGAEQAILDVEYKDMVCKKIVATRQSTKKRLEELGFVMPNSKANFLFIKHPKIDAIDIFTQLKEKGILVRHFKRPKRIDQYLRVSIGTDEEMDVAIREIEKIVTKK